MSSAVNVFTATRRTGFAYDTSRDSAQGTPSPSATEPTHGDGYVKCQNYNFLKVIPAIWVTGGGDADGKGAILKVWRIANHLGLWIPDLAFTGTATGGEAVGVSGEGITQFEYFCDTLAQVSGDDMARVSTGETDSQVVSSVTIDLEGAEWAFISWADGASPPDEFNAAWGLF